MLKRLGTRGIRKSATPGTKMSTNYKNLLSQGIQVKMLQLQPIRI